MLTGNFRGLTEMEFNRIIQENSQGTGEVAPWLRALIERRNSVPSTHTGQITIACNSGSRRSDGLFWAACPPVHMHACAHAQRCIVKRNIKTINQVEKAELHSEIYREWTWGDFFFYFWNYCIVWIFCRQKDSFGTRHCTNCEEHCQTDAQDPPSTACSFWVLAHLQELRNTIVWKDRSASK